MSGRLIVAVVAVCVVMTAVGPALVVRRPPSEPPHRYGPRPLIDRRAAGQPRRRRRR